MKNQQGTYQLLLSSPLPRPSFTSSLFFSNSNSTSHLHPTFLITSLTHHSSEQAQKKCCIWKRTGTLPLLLQSPQQLRLDNKEENYHLSHDQWDPRCHSEPLSMHPRLQESTSPAGGLTLSPSRKLSLSISDEAWAREKGLSWGLQ